MANLDRTGPEGRGPLTGRGMGKCSDKDSSKKETIEEQNEVWGLGRGGRPRGGGLGFGGGRRWKGRFGRGRFIDDEQKNQDEK